MVAVAAGLARWAEVQRLPDLGGNPTYWLKVRNPCNGMAHSRNTSCSSVAAGTPGVEGNALACSERRNLTFFAGRWIEALFKPTNRGPVFYPYGRFAPGRRITSEQQKALVQFLRRWGKWANGSLLVYGASLVLLGIWPAISVAVVVSVGLWAVYRLKVAQLTSGYTAIEEKISRFRHLRERARTLSWIRIWSLVGTSVSMVGASVFVLFTNRPHSDWNTIAAVGGLLFFGLGFVLFLSYALLKLLDGDD
jgi:hypothetical protein